MPEWLSRLRDWLRRDRLDAELEEELRFHRQQLEREELARGASPEAARLTAARTLGSPLRAREGARDRWSWPWLDHLLRDLRYATRGLARTPGFSLTVILTLGLGVGANAAIFGVIDRLMFRPFPFLEDPGQVHRVYLQSTYRGRTNAYSVMPYTRYLDLSRQAGAFSQFAAVTERLLAVGAGAAAREQLIAGVSSGFFPLFRAAPALGRYFGPSEDVTPLGAPVVVLGYQFWQSELGGRPVLGETLRIGIRDYTIIGVAPAGFVGIAESAPPVAYIPITSFPLAAGENKTGDYYLNYNWDWTTVVVRRKPGISEEVASADLTRAWIVSRTVQRAINPALLPDSVTRPRAYAGALKTAAGPGAGLESRTLLWVSGVALIVLLITCANVTNLMFARALHRRREISVRLALGVNRARLAMQFLAESLLLAALGGAAGVLIAQWGGLALRRLVLPAGVTLEIFRDGRTLLAVAGLSLAAGILIAIAPALLATRGDLAAALKSDAREGTRQRSRARAALLLVQGALSVLLLIGAHLFVRSLNQVRSMRLGYDPAPVLMALTNLRGLELDSADMVAYRRRLLEAARSIPGVVAAARVNSRPFGTNTTWLSVPGVDSLDRLGRFNFQASDPHYFKVMGTLIVRGRSLTPADHEHAPKVVVVSESMARILWPGADPIGRCIEVRFARVEEGASAECITVVGVAEDAIHQNLTDASQFMYYLPIDQVNPTWGMQIFLRLSGDNSEAAIEQVRRSLNAAMPGEGYVRVQPLNDLVQRHQRSWRLGATMFVAFGVLALLVAAVGLYGVITYDVTQRMHELGVRIALGARAGHVLQLVVGHGFRIAAAGVGIGILLALVLARWLQPLLFRQSARDPLTYALVSAVLLGVSVAASALPAFRATRADPNRALRAE